jgi:LPS-assembly lipoprotein
MSLRVNIAALLLLLPLAACGFSPMYGKKNSGSSQLNAGVQIDPIAGREGQLLRIALEDGLNPGGVVPHKPAYRLATTLQKTAVAIGVDRDGTVSRYNLYLDSYYRLYRNSDNLVVTTGKIRRVSSYNNLTGAYFSTFVSENDAIKQGIREMGEEYRQRLAIYLSDPNAGTPLAEQPDPNTPMAAPEPPPLPEQPLLYNAQ